MAENPIYVDRQGRVRVWRDVKKGEMIEIRGDSAEWVALGLAVPEPTILDGQNLLLNGYVIQYDP